MLLAIDTSTSMSGLACLDGGRLVAECVWEARREQTSQLVPQLDVLLRHLGRPRGSISAVAVATGPGSWAGLRVGLSTAKGLALALGVPLAGVGVLDALAHQFGGAGLPVVPLVRLGRDRIATSDPLGGGPRNTSVAELAAEIGVRTLFCGDVDGELRRELEAQLGDRARFPSPAAAARRPGYLAELAWRRLQGGPGDDIATLEPIYLGQPVRPAPS